MVMAEAMPEDGMLVGPAAAVLTALEVEVAREVVAGAAVTVERRPKRREAPRKEVMPNILKDDL
jgi:hypothetical protein